MKRNNKQEEITHRGLQGSHSVMSGEAHGGEDGDAFLWRLVIQRAGSRKAGTGQVCLHV